ncbi:hypothetical protein CRI93_05740 [Longimonas halophila]|uniref:Uncharacterized protein n=2 Tax=Longimonas halophila TaxID=1469170 RepID=A0A2H3P1W4_9BACT|nr:hypothetical protein CRI93_05740 [Longimonas halophila]
MVLLVGCVGLLGSSTVQAQAPALERDSERMAELVVAPVYQHVDDGTTQLDAWSSRIQLTVPLLARTVVQSSIQYGLSTGEALSTVQGFTDLQLRVQHTALVRQGRLVVGVDANVPTGTEALTARELRTTIQTSQRPYGFQVPTFGQGWSVAPVVTWAVPATQNLALGVGLSGRYQGGYRPLASSTADYVPGHEVELRLGGDYRIGADATVALDGTATYIAPDTEGGQTRFEAKYTTSVRVQYLWQRRSQAIRLQARYESWPESRYRPVLLTEENVGTGAPVTQQVLPSIWQSAAGYTQSLVGPLGLGLRGGVSHYTATNRFDAQTVGRLQVAPRLQWDDTTLTVYTAYTGGSFTGFEAGLRTAIQF